MPLQGMKRGTGHPPWTWAMLARAKFPRASAPNLLQLAPQLPPAQSLSLLPATLRVPRDLGSYTVVQSRRQRPHRPAQQRQRKPLPGVGEGDEPAVARAAKRRKTFGQLAVVDPTKITSLERSVVSQAQQ